MASPTNNSSNNNNATTKNAASSPRLTESELIAAQQTSLPPLPPPESVPGTEAPISMAEEESGATNGNAGKRTAWNKVSNGAVEIGPGFDPGSWPALSDSARVSGKLSSGSDSIVKGPPPSSDGSLLTVSSQGTATSLKNSGTNSTHNSIRPAHQRSMRRSGAGIAAIGGGSEPPGSHGRGGEANSSNHSPRDHAQRNSQPRAPDDQAPQQQPRNSYTKQNGVANFRGNGSQNPNYRGRRDHDRANQDWVHHRNFSGRDAYMQTPRGVPIVRHPAPQQPLPPNYAPFIYQPMHLPIMRPYGFQIGDPQWPFVPAPISWNLQTVMPPYTASDFPLHSKIVMQIDYYFSNENLVSDIFLRQNMDDQGWVPVAVIAKFKKIAALTDDVQLILNSLQSSVVVEVQGDKIRRQNDWNKWIMPAEMRIVSLEKKEKGNSSASRQAEGLNNPSQQSSSKENGGVAAYGDLHGSSSAGNLS